eukprot:CAMPEP_0196661254 /NCGR_PEP_ID=MMETSP1086-20130531/43420_1 /TAXON_ID=77921 /ORGANISM="Cyanoptyche  gloeocystis , Strain SAG4.97" /LENGTH=110 /DNA_ID=CAMNT_0041996061 /DNA_START=58 /DNA_END=390 /DNA_ORIENTATION=-
MPNEASLLLQKVCSGQTHAWSAAGMTVRSSGTDTDVGRKMTPGSWPNFFAKNSNILWPTDVSSLKKSSSSESQIFEGLSVGPVARSTFGFFPRALVGADASLPMTVRPKK